MEHGLISFIWQVKMNGKYHFTGLWGYVTAEYIGIMMEYEKRGNDKDGC